MVEQELGRQQDERLLERPVHLAAERVKELRRRRCVDDEEIGVTFGISPHKLDHEFVPHFLHGDFMLCPP